MTRFAFTSRILSKICDHKQFLVIIVALNTGLVVLSALSLLLADPNKATQVITIVNFGISGTLYLLTLPLLLICKQDE